MKQLFSKFINFRTDFPKLDLDSVPDLDESSLQSDDDSIVDAGKVDEDVRVWMDLMKRLPKQQQMFLLQNHLRTQLGVVPPPTKKSRTKTTSGSKQPGFKKIKKFRFAEITGGAVRTEKKLISLIDQENWWDEQENRDIRMHAIRMVKYCRTRRPDIAMSLVILSEDMDAKNEHMDKLIKDSFSRGLESHMVPTLAALRKTVVQDVLEEQKACEGLSYEEAAEKLRSVSLEISEPSRTLARKLGECDEMDALASSLSKWTRQRSDKANNGGGFFD